MFSRHAKGAWCASFVLRFYVEMLRLLDLDFSLFLLGFLELMAAATESCSTRRS